MGLCSCGNRAGENSVPERGMGVCEVPEGDSVEPVPECCWSRPCCHVRTQHRRWQLVVWAWRHGGQSGGLCIQESLSRLKPHGLNRPSQGFRWVEVKVTRTQKVKELSR